MAMSHQPPNAAGISQLQKLQNQHQVLKSSLDEVKMSYSNIGGRYAAIHPAVVSNPLIHYTHRELLSTSFNRTTRDEALLGLVEKMDEHLAVVQLLLRGGKSGEASVVLRATEDRMAQAQKYLGRLEKGVAQHEEVEGYLRAKGLFENAALEGTKRRENGQKSQESVRAERRTERLFH